MKGRPVMLQRYPYVAQLFSGDSKSAVRACSCWNVGQCQIRAAVLEKSLMNDSMTVSGVPPAASARNLFVNRAGRPGVDWPGGAFGVRSSRLQWTFGLGHWMHWTCLALTCGMHCLH